MNEEGPIAMTPPFYYRCKDFEDARARGYVGVWVLVAVALPPARAEIIVCVRGDNCPAYGWMKYAAGDPESPYFVVPQMAAIGPRGCRHGKPNYAADKQDVTHWFLPESPLPSTQPEGYEKTPWGLKYGGWEFCDGQ